MLKSIDNFSMLNRGNQFDVKETNIASEHYQSTLTEQDNGFGNSPIGLFFGGIVVWFLDSVQVILIAVAIFIVFHVFIASPHTLEGPSMEPNFCEGDLVLADKITPNFQGYQFGDVIIFKHDEENDYIKRIIGLPGDTVRIQNGSVFRNGSKLDEPYLPQGRSTTLFAGSRMSEALDYKVPEGKYFVLGDNRDRSVDSRSFLFIDPKVNTIKGKISFLVWPARDARAFDKNAVKPIDNCRG